MNETFAYWWLIAWMVFGGASTVYCIGKPREPITGGVGVFTLLVLAVHIWAVVTLANA